MSSSSNTTTTMNNNKNTNEAAAVPAIGSESGGESSTPTATGAAAAAVGARPLLASAKRPLMTHSKDGKLLSEKKLRRLEKNRLSARECRRRKREATENLERQINMLEGENLRLRLQLQIGEEAEEKTRQEQEKVMEGIVGLLESGSSEAEVYENIEKFKEKFADYGRDRRSAIEFHLRNIERLLMPTQTTTIAMRALQGGESGAAGGQGQEHHQAQPQQQHAAAAAAAQVQQPQPPIAAVAAALPPPDVHHHHHPHQQPQPMAFAVSPTSTIESAGTTASTTTTTTAHGVSSSNIIPLSMDGGPPQTQDPKALFQYLVNHLEVSPDQAAALKDSRFVAQELDSHLENALKVLEELKARLAQCTDDLETEFDNVRAILTPTQSAKFLVWVANNGACMHMLNELWARAYPGNPSGPYTHPHQQLEPSPSMEGSSP